MTFQNNYEKKQRRALWQILFDNHKGPQATHKHSMACALVALIKAGHAKARCPSPAWASFKHVKYFFAVWKPCKATAFDLAQLGNQPGLNPCFVSFFICFLSPLGICAGQATSTSSCPLLAI